MFVIRSIFDSHGATLLAQTEVVRETTAFFSGPQFFTALVSGLFLTFGFQMLLTNLSVATGISVFSLAPNDDKSDRHDGGSSLPGIGTMAGVWTVVTVSIALFIACLLAVKLSLVPTATMGMTVGLSIWAAYFSILVWISSTTVGSLVGSVVSTATKGFQAVFGTATAALGMKAAGSELVSSAEAAAAAVRREMTAYIDPQEVQSSFRDLLSSVKPPEINVQDIRAEFEKIIKDSEVSKMVDKDNLPTLSRETFENLLKERTDLSPRDVKKIVDELDRSWHGTLSGTKQGGGLGKLIEQVRSAKPQDLLSGNFKQQLDRYVQDMGKGENSSQLEQALGALMGVVLGRVDLSDLDVEKIKGQVKNAQSQLKTQVGQVTDKVATPTLSPGASVIRADVEHYLRETYSWQMTPDRIAREFRDVLYDPNADARTIRQAIESLKPEEFSSLLQARGVFTQEKIAEIVRVLDRVRLQVLTEVRTAEAAGMLEKTQNAIDVYLRATPKHRNYSLDRCDSGLQRLARRWKCRSARVALAAVENQAVSLLERAPAAQRSERSRKDTNRPDARTDARSRDRRYRRIASRRQGARRYSVAAGARIPPQYGQRRTQSRGHQTRFTEAFEKIRKLVSTTSNNARLTSIAIHWCNF